MARAAHHRMRIGRTTAMIGGAWLLFAGVGDARRAGETPRATDLLRAEKLADEAEKRLQLPRKRTAGWRRGGAGFDGAGPRAPESGGVTIKVAPPRRAPAKR
jgi:hypothetical protein